MSDDKRRLEADRSRRQFLAYLVAGGATVPLAACTEASELSGAADEGLHNPLLWAVAWQQTAAEFGALCHQAYNVARMRLDLAIGNRRSGDKRLAVITDMDNDNASTYFHIEDIESPAIPIRRASIEIDLPVGADPNYCARLSGNGIRSADLDVQVSNDDFAITSNVDVHIGPSPP